MIRFLDQLTFVFFTLSGTLFFMILKRMLPLRRSRILQILAWVLGVWLSDTVIYSNDIYALVGTMLGMGLYLLVFYRGQVMEKFSVLFVFYPILIAVNYLFQDMGSRLFFSRIEKVGGEVVWDDPTRLLSTGIHTGSIFLRLLFWVGIFLFVKRFLARNALTLPVKMWWLVDVLLLAPMVAVFTIIYFMPGEMIVNYPICVASIFSSIGSMYLAAYIYNSMQTAYHMEEMEKQHRDYEDLLREEERVRSIYHDMKNHLLVLEAASSDSQLVRQSIEELSGQISSYEDYIYTGNRSLDVILRDKARKARALDIDFGAVVRFEDGDFLEPMDISSIFGNSLDNAIEACEKLPRQERMITIKTGRIRDMLVIAVENNAAREEAKERGGKRTAKEDAFLHGFGLANIRKSVEKYAGQCNAGMKDGRFVLKIVIPVP